MYCEDMNNMYNYFLSKLLFWQGAKRFIIK